MKSKGNAPPPPPPPPPQPDSRPADDSQPVQRLASLRPRAQGTTARSILGSAPPKELRPQTHVRSHVRVGVIQREQHGGVRKKGENPCELPRRSSVVWGRKRRSRRETQQSLVTVRHMGEPCLTRASGLKDIQSPSQLKSLRFQGYNILSGVTFVCFCITRTEWVSTLEIPPTTWLRAHI